MSSNPCLDAALNELSLAGVTDVRKTYGGKHLLLTFQSTPDTPPHTYSMPISSSDWRAGKNVRSDIRKLLREDGMLRDRKNQFVPKQPEDRVAMLERRLAECERRLGIQMEA